MFGQSFIKIGEHGGLVDIEQFGCELAQRLEEVHGLGRLLDVLRQWVLANGEDYTLSANLKQNLHETPITN